MKNAIAHNVSREILRTLIAALVVTTSGYCVCHSLSIKNDTGAFVTIATKDTGQGVGIPIGKKRAVSFWGGPMVAIVGSNMWFYPKIAYEDYPEARRRVFRFGICQAGFGYFVTRATLEPSGRLVVGSGTYEPERQTQW
jgi:hypothetical protein